jgi:hypothetical protein
VLPLAGVKNEVDAAIVLLRPSAAPDVPSEPGADGTQRAAR